MRGYDCEYPGYGFAAHKGYPAPTHLSALQAQGVCPLHRRTFRPVAELCALSAPASSSPAPSDIVFSSALSSRTPQQSASETERKRVRGKAAAVAANNPLPEAS